ncbi:MAG: nuclear transport factor 2 family protein [Akkermansiaceae bacterium]|nr:nuclear transport factor 2 family protein [Armatimonadota bacterium]
MDPVTELMHRYIATWNETDAARRRELIAQTWTEDAFYIDPMMRGETRAGIDAMIGGVQTQFPGFRLRLTGTIDAHHDRARFAWELGPEGETAPVGGIDFAVLSGGRIQSITGFLDFAPQAPAV